jgi:hypothetical protein
MGFSSNFFSSKSPGRQPSPSSEETDSTLLSAEAGDATQTLPGAD